MTGRTERAAAWIYRGVWGVVVELFKVPHEPPALPTREGQHHDAFQPSEGFLRYLKLQFWIALLFIDVVLTGAWIFATVVLIGEGQTAWAVVIAPFALALIVLPDVVAYIGIHLRYDTMWYVLTDRSVRIRRGLWVLHETTITFENVQNVTVTQGPLERWFGIASVIVDTAGGGAAHGHQHAGTTHRGVIEGIANAQEVRELIMARARASSSAGLGDDHPSEASSATGAARGADRGNASHAETAPRWTPAHVAALQAIRDELRSMSIRRA